MDDQIIHRLNEINQKFYKTTAKEFSDSRTYYWHGWREILPYLELLVAYKPKLRVLDVGCGNGRFGLFLLDYLPAIEIEYTGIDNNQTLLTLAEKKLQKSHFTLQFQQRDIVKELLGDTFLTEATESYDLIVLFGVLHHIPTYNLRKQLVTTLSKHVSEQGLLALTLWRFLDSNRLSKKRVPTSKASLDEQELDKNDFLISWERGKRSFRYCHYTDAKEEDQLITATKLELLSNFESDGKEGKGNKYLILGKNLGV